MFVTFVVGGFHTAAHLILAMSSQVFGDRFVEQVMHGSPLRVGQLTDLRQQPRIKLW